MKPVRLAWFLWAVTLAAFLFLGFSMIGHAEPIAQAKGSKATVTLYREPCAVEAVANLPKRATWEEGGKIFEGCYGLAGSIVMLYFDDRSVVAFPVQAFVALVDA